MKHIFKFLSIIFVVFALLVFYRTLSNPQSVEEPNSEEVLGEISDENFVDIGEYRVDWFEALGEQVTLIPNFSEKKITADIVSESQCKNAINASFYSENYQPIGLFVKAGEEVSRFKSNNLFNGIFSINKLETPRITREVPRDPLDIAIQSGPLIMENDKLNEYSSETDKNARRMLALVTGENKIIFATVYDPEAVFNGPKLSELSGIISLFEERLGQNVADAINLDGGSASSFYSDSVTLKEISPVGSLFCIK